MGERQTQNLTNSQLTVQKKKPYIMFKNSKRILTGLAFATAILFSHHIASAAKGGTSVQHFMFKTAMVSTGVDADASGSVDGSIERQGNAYNQSLKISVAHLD